MPKRSKASLAGEASRERKTGDAGNADAVAVPKYTTAVAPSHRRRLAACAKTALGWVLAWRPSPAIALGHLITHVWRGFRRA
jgi:hypothetical protein